MSGTICPRCLSLLSQPATSCSVCKETIPFQPRPSGDEEDAPWRQLDRFAARIRPGGHEVEVRLMSVEPDYFAWRFLGSFAEAAALLSLFQQSGMLYCDPRTQAVYFSDRKPSCETDHG